jgi:toxin ParE1/3/4
MRFELNISHAAYLDIEDTFLWYEKQKPGLGISFEETIESAFHLIGSDPFICQIRYKSIRVLFLKKFPYGIHYRIKNEKIEVIAVFHCARSPKSWYQRLTKRK